MIVLPIHTGLQPFHRAYYKGYACYHYTGDRPMKVVNISRRSNKSTIKYLTRIPKE